MQDVTKDSKKNPEYHVVVTIRRLRTDKNCPAETTYHIWQPPGPLRQCGGKGHEKGGTEYPIFRKFLFQMSRIPLNSSRSFPIIQVPSKDHTLTIVISNSNWFQEGYVFQLGIFSKQLSDVCQTSVEGRNTFSLRKEICNFPCGHTVYPDSDTVIFELTLRFFLIFFRLALIQQGESDMFLKYFIQLYKSDLKLSFITLHDTSQPLRFNVPLCYFPN